VTGTGPGQGRAALGATDPLPSGYDYDSWVQVLATM